MEADETYIGGKARNMHKWKRERDIKGCGTAGLDKEYTHVINHMEAYVKGNIHTNGIENFWSLLKRTIRGPYVSVEPFHRFRYLDEQSFRFNNRKDDNGGRFANVASNVAGKRVMYRAFTGKDIVHPPSTPP